MKMEFRPTKNFGKMDTDFKSLINQPGFFPYYNGSFEIHEDDYEIPKNCILVFGQDWGTVTQYNNLKEKNRNNGEGKNPTFDNLYDLIGNYNWKNSIFLSNVFMGLRNGGKSTGENPEISNPIYRKKCESFLEIQLNTLNPKCVIVLGKVPFKFIAETTGCHFNEIKNYREHYKTHKEIIHYEFKSMNINLCAIPHVSHRLRNYKEIDPQTVKLLDKISQL